LIAANKLIEAVRFLLPVEAAGKSRTGGAGTERETIGPRAKKKGLQAADKAWAINQFILAKTNAPATNRGALRRFLIDAQARARTGPTGCAKTSVRTPGLIILFGRQPVGQQG